MTGSIHTKGATSKAFLRQISFLLVLVSQSLAVVVNIDYSFAVPDEFGVATLKSANCCPYGILPDNFTNGFVPPTVYGIGVQKGGTTTLYSYLKKHPLIIGGAKEMHYFDRFSLTKTSYKGYLSRWKVNRDIREGRLNKTEKLTEDSRLANGGQLFEITPSYFLIPFAACRIKYFTPNAKFIVLLREPASRAHSGFNHILHYKQKLPREEHPDWMKKHFSQIAKEGVQLIQTDPRCNLLSGLGNTTYNDCMQCLMMLGPKKPECSHQMFVSATNYNSGFSCSPLAKEVLLRGFYGAQLAWWFTLFPPSRFKILNSEEFFRNPRKVLDDIMDFLGYDQQYTETMLVNETKHNGGRYDSSSVLEAEATKSMLREFYIRPNLELYRLLKETGHQKFLPFESYLQKIDYLDCKAEKNINTGLCGTGQTSHQIEIGPHQDNATDEVQSQGNIKRQRTDMEIYNQQWFSILPLSEYTIHVFFSLILVFSSLYSLRLIRSVRAQISSRSSKDTGQ